MRRNFLAFLLVALLLNATSFTAPRSVCAGGDPDAAFVEKVKAEVARLGVGANARVKVRLRDKTKIEGHVSEAADEHFVVTNAKTGAATTVKYSEVERIKGNNLSTGTKIGIGVAVAAAVGIIIAIVTRRGDGRNDSPCERRGITSPCPPGCVCTQ